MGGAPAFPETGPQNRTATIQREYEQKLRGRFGSINAEMRRGIVERGVLGVRSESASSRTPTASTRSDQFARDDFTPTDLTPGTVQSWNDSPSERTAAFIRWVEDQQAAGVLSVVSDTHNPFVSRAWDAGTAHAERQLRDSGADPDAIERGTIGAVRRRGGSGGGSTGGLTVGVGGRGPTPPPVSASALETLYSRNFSLLEGITDDHSNRIQRVLTDGFLAGENPRDIASDITEATGMAKNRSTALARYEVMHAHTISSVESYAAFGVELVNVITHDPCPSCEAIEASNPYPVADVIGIIPDHPSCQCTISPVISSMRM